ncbi:MAG TPA: 5-methyltetrahydropteroyltriglutamate--homocysteine S-methyltransferase, partial [Candidatus Sulfotelmatobacter sp.]|nr:5-methyltetrahydropteroyltriglutamate--homocysteine S-methyltransferase [Candidatus Sulfotelmatobacter sp.]
FAMARGGPEVTAMEMTKWFDTNYHFLVPELGPDTRFSLSSTKPFRELEEARSLGISARPVILGPVTFLLLGKPAEGAPQSFERLQLLEPLLEVYRQMLSELRRSGAEWVQLDEPAFVCDRSSAELHALRMAYESLGSAGERPKLLVSTYFDHAGSALDALAAAPLEALGLDFTRHAASNLALVRQSPALRDKRLVAGVVDGRNVWANDLDGSLELLEELRGLAAEVVVSTSCSLQFVPLDLEAERRLDAEIRPWLAFARQKLDEVVLLARGLSEGREAIAAELEAGRRMLDARRSSRHTGNSSLRSRLDAVRPEQARRASPFRARQPLQHARLGLPILPTTTIGSFPQTREVRAARTALGRGEIDRQAYEDRLRAEIERVIRLQEEIGIDVLVHGEPERNDMVQYFGEQLDGFAFTENGWVQSYGSRYVRPPIIYGDVTRPGPMTVGWARYAQSLTSKPVKGMLTGPVTMLKWSFVRDDQPESLTARQAALALRDEVADLEAAGIAAIQVDEPAIREALPLRRERRAEYLRWAVEAFGLATAVVRDDTQIHTHMCYSEFGDVVGAIADMDADVTSVEAARSRMEIVGEMAHAGFDREIGPGIYDIHSPRVPSPDEIESLLEAALDGLAPNQLWVNPDCGLKTRTYEEVVPALRNMVAAARAVRQRLAVAAR